MKSKVWENWTLGSLLKKIETFAEDSEKLGKLKEYWKRWWKKTFNHKVSVG